MPFLREGGKYGRRSVFNLWENKLWENKKENKSLPEHSQICTFETEMQNL